MAREPREAAARQPAIASHLRVGFFRSKSTAPLCRETAGEQTYTSKDIDFDARWNG